MTENAVAVQDDGFSPDVLTAPTTKAIQRLELEAKSMQVAYQMATSLSKTTMVPETYQQGAINKKTGQPQGEVAAYNLAAAMMYGAELGMSAMQSAQNIFVVKGKPAVYSRTMAAQVRRAGYQIEEVEASDKRVVWKALRDGVWALSEWSIERAQQAGYTSNALYQSNPQEMLRAKCIAEVCRIKFQDVLLGMAYSVEELQLIEGVSVQRVVKKAGSKGTDKLREIAEQKLVAPADHIVESHNNEADVDKPDEGDEPQPDPPSVSNDQVGQIRALYKARGVTGQAVLDDVTQFLQKKVTSLNKISADEADAVIASLQKAD